METYIDNIKLESPICNASGVNCIKSTDLDNLNNNNYCGAIVTKSCTVNLRTGNNMPRYWNNNIYSINSSGLPNYGYKYYSEWIKNTPLKKQCFMSTAPLNYNELNTILSHINDSHWLTYPEINLTCPNICNNFNFASDLEKTNDYLNKINEIMGDKKYGLKMPPMFDKHSINELSDLLKSFSKLSYITCINSIPNGLSLNINNNCTDIIPNNGLGGIGGPACLPIGLSNVYQFKNNLNYLDVIGCGGISSGEDVYKYLMVGASATQIGTSLYNEGIGIFERIYNELNSILKKKNIKTIKNIVKISM